MFNMLFVNVHIRLSRNIKTAKFKIAKQRQNSILPKSTHENLLQYENVLDHFRKFTSGLYFAV